MFVRRLAARLARDLRVSSSRTEHGSEVDLVVENGREVFALELKASGHVTRGDSRGLRSFADAQGTRHRAMVLYLGAEPRRIEGIDVLPWQEGLRAMGL